MNLKLLIENIDSWGEFQNELINLPKKQKGDAFELLLIVQFIVNR